MTSDAASAGALIRAARQRAHLSQSELARRAGITQSVVSAYETGSRQPSVATLQRLITAAGFQLDLQLRHPATGLQKMSGPLGRQVLRHRDALLHIAAARGASNLRVFGSVARGEDAADSDIDLLVDIEPRVGLLGLARLERDLEAVLQAEVDLVPESDLKPGIRTQVMAELVAL